MLKFGTGQITAVGDQVEDALTSKIARALTPAEWEALVQETGEDNEGE
jgi:hypothetical protein